MIPQDARWELSDDHGAPGGTVWTSTSGVGELNVGWCFRFGSLADAEETTGSKSLSIQRHKRWRRVHIFTVLFTVSSDSRVVRYKKTAGSETGTLAVEELVCSWARRRFRFTVTQKSGEELRIGRNHGLRELEIIFASSHLNQLSLRLHYFFVSSWPANMVSTPKTIQSIVTGYVRLGDSTAVGGRRLTKGCGVSGGLA